MDRAQQHDAISSRQPVLSSCASTLTLLLLASFLPFTAAIVATHLFATFLPLSHLTIFHTGSPGERVAVVLFGLNLTLAALMVYRAIRYAGGTPGIAADDVAEEDLQAFAKERRGAALLQAGATVVGVFLPVIAVVFYLAVSVQFIVEPLRRIRIRARRATQPQWNAAKTGVRCRGRQSRRKRGDHPGRVTTRRDRSNRIGQ